MLNFLSVTIYFVYIGEHLCSEEKHVEELRVGGMMLATYSLMAQVLRKEDACAHTQSTCIYMRNL